MKGRKRKTCAINRKIMNDPRIATLCGATSGIFDIKRMAYGGFKSLVQV